MLEGGAGGAGDYAYQERKPKFYLEGGLLRVRSIHDEFDKPTLPLPDRAQTEENHEK